MRKELILVQVYKNSFCFQQDLIIEKSFYNAEECITFQKECYEKYINCHITVFTYVLENSSSGDLLFDILVERLSKEGYLIKLKSFSETKFATFTGNNLEGKFCNFTNGKCYSYLDGRIVVENVNTKFNWYNATISLVLPKTKKELDFLIKKMKFLSTEKGKKFAKKWNKIDSYE